MSSYQRFYDPDFENDLRKLRKNWGLINRLQKKIEEVLKNPYHYKPLRNVLKNRRRTHIGSFVLIFEVREEEKLVVFHSFQHHDEAYK